MIHEALLFSVMMKQDEARIVLHVLREALKGNNFDVLRSLVPNVISPNALHPGAKWFPLLWMAVWLHECTDEGHAFVQYLIDQGADPDTPTHNAVS